jgi:N6-L-threonylcarbamoyladenine synthase
MIILSIETSCDESSLAVLKVEKENNDISFEVLSHLIHSQIDVHREYGGVFPALAKREHQKNLVPLLKETLKKTNLLNKKNNQLEELDEKVKSLLGREPNLSELFIEFVKEYELPKFDLISVTNGPGLEPALWVGVNFAKTISYLTDVPILGVNHMEGHILSVFTEGKTKFNIPEMNFPVLSLLISGGHTELVLMESWHSYKILGKTLDDAVGEAYDKVARLLNLSYPGGPEISKLAEKSRITSSKKYFSLPRPMLNSQDYNFSFSGLKTAVLYTVKDKTLTEEEKIDLCREFENSVTEVLLKKTKKAILEYGIQTLIIAGGVSANKNIREKFSNYCKENNIKLHIPTSDVTGDNALMIGIVAGLEFLENKKISLNSSNLDELKANGNLQFK